MTKEYKMENANDEITTQGFPWGNFGGVQLHPTSPPPTEWIGGVKVGG